MRGKLRDKRIATKRDALKREVIERRRPAKRDTRMSWLIQEVEDDEYELDDEEKLETPVSPKK